MQKVKDILNTKGNAVFAVDPYTLVNEAIILMAEKNVGGLLIVENGKLVGIFTERDYARKLLVKGRSSKETPIGSVMTKTPITVTPETKVEDCMQVMSDKHIRHLPVVENDEVVGVISIGDVVKNVIEQQKSIIEHLESYITQ
jgi:CBS domain-containing protein